PGRARSARGPLVVHRRRRVPGGYRCRGGGMSSDRRFVREALRSGLELGVVTHDDILRHVTADVLAHHLPVTLKAKLLEASLAAEKMTPGLVVETVGVEGLGEHVPVATLWACVVECARRAVGSDDATASGG